MSNQTIIKGLPFSDYANRPGLNASLLTEGVRSMKHMRYAAANPTEPTAAMRWGKLCHSCLLEPERFDRDYAVFDGEARRGKAYNEFVEANDGREIITAVEAERLAYLIEQVHGNPAAKTLLTEGDREVSVFWDTEEYGAAKCRCDVLSPNHIVDVKTTGQIERFTPTAARMLYHVRLGWYQIGVRGDAAQALPVYILAIEAEPPHDCIIYEYDAEALAVGRDVAVAVAKRYRECERSGDFPGICADIKTLRLPEWMLAGDDPIALKVGGESIEL